MSVFVLVQGNPSPSVRRGSHSSPGCTPDVTVLRGPCWQQRCRWRRQLELARLGEACVGYIRESNSPDFLPPVVLAVFAGGIEIYSIEEKYSLWGQLALPEQKSKL